MDEGRKRCKACNSEVRLAKDQNIDSMRLAYDTAYIVEWCPKCVTDKSGPKLKISLEPRSWAEIAQISIFNLHVLSGKTKYGFSFKDICDFVRQHWDLLCPGKSQEPNPVWINSLHGALSHNPLGFERKHGEENFFSEYLFFSKKLIPPKNENLRNALNTSQLKKRKSDQIEQPKRITNAKRKPEIADSRELLAQDRLAPYSIPYNTHFYHPNERIPLKMRMEPENTAPQVYIHKDVSFQSKDDFFLFSPFKKN